MKKLIFFLLLIVPAFAQNTLVSHPAATAPASDDYLYLEGLTNKTRKLSGQYYEPWLGNPGANGYLLSGTTAGGRSWVPLIWGGIGGTLSAQSDLNAALAGKAGTSTTVNGQPLTGNITVTAAPSGPAGGVLAGTYPNPTFALTTGSGFTVLSVSPVISWPSVINNTTILDTSQPSARVSISANTTFTFNTLPLSGARFGFASLKNTDSVAHTITIPSSYSYALGAFRTSFTLPAGVEVAPYWTYDSIAAGYYLTGEPVLMADLNTVVTPAPTTDWILTEQNGVSGKVHPSGFTAGGVITNANLTGPITSVGNATSVAAQTGTGSTFVMNTSPMLVTPNIGTPSVAVMTNATGLPIATGVSGLGTGVAAALAVNVGTVGAPVVNGGALGTPASGVATNLTGTAAGLIAGNVTTNANLSGPIASVGNVTSITSQTGTGTVFAMQTAPTFVTNAASPLWLNPQALGAATADGLFLQNTTPAAAFSQKWSPALHLQGNNWRTSSPAVSQPQDFQMFLETVQMGGSSTYGAKLHFQFAGGTTAGGGVSGTYADIMTIQPQAIGLGSTITLTGNQITFNNTGMINATGITANSLPSSLYFASGGVVMQGTAALNATTVYVNDAATTLPRTFTVQMPDQNVNLQFTGNAVLNQDVSTTASPSFNRIISTVATGTAPFTVTSTTPVLNLTASNVTTNANLSGPITSVGNTTAIAAQTGTGSTLVTNTAPTISSLTVNGLLTTTPNTQTGATYTVLATDVSIIANAVGTQTLTLGTATAGRVLILRTIAAQAVVSASANVVPLAGGAAGTAILPATAGKWALLQGDGTNWQVMMAN